MTTDGGFLSRWSRRKAEARRTDGTEGEPDPQGPEPCAEPAEGVAPPAPESPSDASPEVEAVPLRLDDLTAESDLAPFLRVGVPAPLRKAALRRMWSLDPTIRDFVGEARDYDFDWNVAGGAPVSGPLGPGDDVEATLRRMFGRPDAPEDERAPEDDGAGPAERSGDAREASAPESPRLAADADEGRPASPCDARDLRASAVPEPARERLAAESSGPTSAPRDLAPARARRHGAATPKLD